MLCPKISVARREDKGTLRVNGEFTKLFLGEKLKKRGATVFQTGASAWQGEPSASLGNVIGCASA